VVHAEIDDHIRYSNAGAGERTALNSCYAAEVESLRQLQFISVDVDTVIFGLFKINRSFVVKVVVRGGDERLSTHYFHFWSKVLTGECSRLQWSFAW
jgi:hypothetical protein